MFFQRSYFFFAGVAFAGQVDFAGVAFAGVAFAGDFLGAFLTSFFGDLSLAILKNLPSAIALKFNLSDANFKTNASA